MYRVYMHVWAFMQNVYSQLYSSIINSKQLLHLIMSKQLLHIVILPYIISYTLLY